MRKTIIVMIITVFTAVSSALFSCTQNDGAIGDLFGLWVLNDFSSDDIHISGEQCEGYSIRFQSNIVQYVQKLPYHDSIMLFGFWRISSDSLLLSFPDVAQRFESPDHITMYEKTSEVEFPIFPTLGFKINTMTNSVLDISRTTPDGIELRYYFKKLN